jgi:ubiquinone/menaquinone biosynthesis C-methylase UbiE
MTEFYVSADKRRVDQPAPAQEKATVESVYDEIAGEYDERIPGSSQADELFTDTEMDFILGKITRGERVLDMGCGTGVIHGAAR